MKSDTKITVLIFIFICITFFNCSKPVAHPDNRLEGKWIFDLTNNDIGNVRTIMTFMTDSNGFIARTRENADRDILGWWTSTLGRIFSGDFKEGSLLHIVKGRIGGNNDSLVLSGIFTSALGNYYFNGTVKGTQMNAVLTNSKKEIYGKVHALKEETKTPLDDYPAIFAKADSITKNNIYNVKVLQVEEWVKFEKNMKDVSAKARDDLDMVFAFFYYSRKLPFSHYALMKMQDKDTADKSESNHFISLQEKNPQTIYMKISSFGGTASEVDSVFNIINQKDYKSLIVDLRDNPGGSIEAGMEFAKNITDREFYGGIFLTQKWFNNHSKPPALNEYQGFPYFSASNYNLIIKGIHDQEGLCLKVIPAEKVFHGKIFILINKNTASTCEPIVYGFKQNKRATIVGETTAGGMLNGEFFDVMNGFRVIVPTADYYTSDGFRIDQKGVTPDIKTKPEEALDYVMNKLIDNNK